MLHFINLQTSLLIPPSPHLSSLPPSSSPPFPSLTLCPFSSSLAVVRPTRHFLQNDLEQVKKRKKAYHKALQESVHLSEKYCQVGGKGKGLSSHHCKCMCVCIKLSCTHNYDHVIFCFTRKIIKMCVFVLVGSVLALLPIKLFVYFR